MDSDRVGLRKSIMIMVAAMVLGLFTVVVSTLTGASTPARADAGVPADPVVIFAEDFENDIDTTALTLSDVNGADTQYVSASGMTYGASPVWNSANRCNGIVTSYDSVTEPTWAESDTLRGERCRDDHGVASYLAVRTLARALGAVAGGNDGNHLVVEQTECTFVGGNSCDVLSFGPTGGVLFATPSLTVPANHFYTVTADVVAAGACPNLNLGYQFQLGGGGVAIDAGPLLDPCTDPDAVVAQTPQPAGPPAATVVSLGRAHEATLFPGTGLAVHLYTTSGLTYGNDGGFDNIVVADVTPHLDWAFTPTPVGTGDSASITFTITNTTDLLAKTPLSFTAQLPDGLHFTDTPAGGTCPATISRTVGGDSLGATDLALTAGQTSCTVTAEVTAATAGTYTLDPSAVTTSGLAPQAAATLAILATQVSVTTSFDTTGRAMPDDQVRVALHAGSPTGPVVSDPTHATTDGENADVTAGTGTTGPYTADPDEALFITQEATGDTDLNAYTTTITCVDAHQVQTGLPSGEAFTGSYELTPVLGADITCTLTSTARPRPTPTPSPASTPTPVVPPPLADTGTPFGPGLLGALALALAAGLTVLVTTTRRTRSL